MWKILNYILGWHYVIHRGHIKRFRKLAGDNWGFKARPYSDELEVINSKTDKEKQPLLAMKVVPLTFTWDQLFEE